MGVDHRTWLQIPSATFGQSAVTLDIKTIFNFYGFYFSKYAVGSATFYVKLVDFVNPGGKGANGHYCDGKFFIRGSDCDHRFTICIDTAIG